MITEFRGQYSFLSNFTLFDKFMLYGGDLYQSNEHFYQAMKFTDRVIRESVRTHPAKGLKNYVKTLPIRSDWDNIKLDVMLFGLRYKFSEHNPNLRQRLVETGNLVIEEGNYWNDKFWGVCLKTNTGQNNLGKLLMQVRDETKETKT